MKESAFKVRAKKHVTLEGISAGKTTHIRGLMAVTFSGHQFAWHHSFSSVASFLKFSDANYSH